MSDNDIFRTLNDSVSSDNGQAEPLAPGQILEGRYRLESYAGRGGMGEVWKAYDQTAERFVALKFVPRDIQRFEDAVLSVKEAFQTIQEISHQSICPVYTLENNPYHGYYVVMKWLEGKTLQQILRRKKGPLPQEEILQILTPIAEALDYAHRSKVMHRDIKPSNIFVQYNGEKIERVYLIDFGLASEIRESLTRVSQIQFDTSGTRPYMPPEQWRGRRQDARTDQYALAVVAYELFAGYLPFNANDTELLRLAVINDEPEKIDDVPNAVNQAIKKALSKNKEDRYNSCIEFINALYTKEHLPSIQSQPVQKPAPLPIQKPLSVVNNVKKPVNNSQTELESLKYLKYRVVNNKVKITGYKEKPEILIISAKIRGMAVTSIWNSAFSGCSSLTHIEIPKSVTFIGNHAFSDCSSLTHIEIPEGVTSIKTGVFSGCSSLMHVEIPKGVTSIEYHAFSDCSSLTHIEIPKGVTSIESGAFSGCNALKKIHISPNNKSYTSIDNVIFSKDRTILICYSAGKENTKYSIPASVTSIEYSAFSGCTSLTHIEIPQGVTSIGFLAFSGCNALKKIHISPDNKSYTSIDNVIFSKDRTILICYSAGKENTKYSIPAGVTSIGSGAFSGCSSLTHIEIPEGVTSIGNFAFSGCSSLTHIEIPKGVTSIGCSAFSGCSSLTYIEIPQGVTSIGDHAFSGCSSLTHIEIPEGVTSIGYFAFSGCSSLTHIEIPEGVTSIGYFAFDEHTKVIRKGA